MRRLLLALPPALLLFGCGPQTVLDVGGDEDEAAILGELGRPDGGFVTQRWFDGGMPEGARISPHVALGFPSAAGFGQPKADWLLVKQQFVAAYDSRRKVPAWVAWDLSPTWLGSTSRSDSFKQDPTLPSSTRQAATTDYTNSGYSRGHLCPSADRNRTSTDNKATFFLTNVVPQTEENNVGPWNDLERDERALARAGRQLYVVAGPLFEGPRRTIGNGVEVPSAVWKVVVVADGASGAVSARAKAVAVIMPNTSSTTGDWRQYRVSIREVEERTGLNFSRDLPDATEDALERGVGDLP